MWLKSTNTSSQADFLIPFVSAVVGDTRQTVQRAQQAALPLTHACSHHAIQTQFLLLPAAQNSTRLLVYAAHISNHFRHLTSAARSLAVSAGSPRAPRHETPAAAVGVETICLQRDEPRTELGLRASQNLSAPPAETLLENKKITWSSRFCICIAFLFPN